MNQHQFVLDLEALRERVAAWGRSASPLTESVDLEEAGEELQVAMEELHVVEEELRRQNTELLLARDAAEAQCRRYQELFQFAPEGYLTTDLEGTIHEVNNAAAKLLGVPAPFLVGKPLVLFVAAEDRRAFHIDLMAGLAETNHVEELQLRIKPRDRASFAAALTVAVANDGRRRPAGLRWLIRDVSGPRPGGGSNGAAPPRPVEADGPARTEVGLQAKVEELADADRRKDEFLAMLAHELRNPLAPLSLSLQVLRRDAPSGSEAAHALDVAGHQVEKLTRLVDELLDVARIRQGKTDLRMEPVDLGAVAAAAVASVQPILAERLHTLETQLPAERVGVKGDAYRLEQVLTNLLTNAAKYTEPGGRITLGVEREGDVVLIRVRDTGVGLVADLLPRIFEPFVQLERNLHRSRGGLGLGLSLVKRFVELHSGSVEAHSDGPGRGSEFVVRLPALVSSPPAAEAAPVETQPPLRSVAVLVVDDNRDAADSLAQLARMWGCQATTAYDGRAAVAAARVQPPHVVFMDIDMPGMDGYETAQKLRQALKRPPLMIALTGYGDEDERMHTRQAGFDCHLLKPVDLSMVKILIKRAGASAPRPQRPQ